MAEKTPIMGKATATREQMLKYVRKVNPQAPDYTELYLRVGAKYGIRGDLAFAQSIKETGYFRYGGSVRAEQNNFAGIGAVSAAQGGASFLTPEAGVEAQMQHLYAYATTQPLPTGVPKVDPRFDLVERSGMRGSAPYWEDLNGKWAVPGDGYGQDIVRIWRGMLALPSSPANPPVANWKKEAMDWLRNEGLILNEHDPDDAVTWAELGTVLRRLNDQMRS